MMHSICPLCKNKSTVFFKNENQLFHQCSNCCGIFRDSNSFLSNIKERERYQHHKNHIKDTGYLKFVSPLLNSVKKNMSNDSFGLDFGCGHTPVISEVLKSEDYKAEVYDPLFFSNKNVLYNKYDFITCCEVIEHFNHPEKEFKLLYKLLKNGGKLFCMTLIYDNTIDFQAWFYKNDPTHVFLYQKETLQWIKNNFKFSEIAIKNRLITFTK